MAEFASAIVGLVAAAEVVTRYVCRYVRHVKHAEHEVLDLLTRTNALYGALKSLQLLEDDMSPGKAMANIDARQITAVMTTLEKVRVKVAGFQNVEEEPEEEPSPLRRQNTFDRLNNQLRNGKINTSNRESQTTDKPSIRKRWKWPFLRGQTQDLAREVEAHTTTISFALSIDGFNVMMQTLNETRSMRTAVDQIQEHMANVARVQLDEKADRALSAVGPFNTRNLHQANLRLRHPGTGLWFTDGDEFQQWLTNPQARLWLHAIPGAGKSILTAGAIEYALQQSTPTTAVAYFYCDYRQPDSLSCRQILGSIAAQLARQSQRSCDALLDFVEKHEASGLQGGRRQELECEAEDLGALINNLCDHYTTAMVFVDGVDECPSEERRSLILHLADIESAKLKIFMSSRDIYDIRELVDDDFEPVSIAARSMDLRLFVASEIEQRLHKRARKRLYLTDPALKGEILNTLISKADGMFRWVAVQLDYICDKLSDADIREALLHAPPSLFGSYERTLQEATKLPDEVTAIAARALKWVVGQGIIDAAALEEALSIGTTAKSSGSTSFISKERILQLCGSLIRLGPGNLTLECAHFSVKEYLISLADGPENLRSFALGDDMRREYAITSLQLYASEEFSSPCQTLGALRKRRARHPFMNLAARQWIYWSDLSAEQDLEILHKVFHPKSVGHLYSWNQGMWPAALAKEDCWRIENEDVTSLHYAAMLRIPGLCSWLLDSGECQQTCSKMIGTPVHCAIIGISLVKSLYDHPSATPVSHVPRANVDATSRLGQVLELLSAETTLLQSHFPNFSDIEVSTLRLAAFHDANRGGNLVFKLLSEAGANCEMDCIEALREVVLAPDCVEVASDLLATVNTANLQVDPLMFSDLLRLSRKAEAEREAKGPALKQTDSYANERGKEASMPSELLQILENDDVEEMVRQLRLNTWTLDHKWRSVGTALHAAARYGSVNVARLLIQEGASLEAASDLGVTPVLEAMAWAENAVGQLLVDAGADIRFRAPNGAGIWHDAAEATSSSAIHFLSNLKDGVLDLLDSPDDNGRTPLMFAASYATSSEHDHLDRVTALLELGANEWAKDNDGWTVLHYASESGHAKTVELLLERKHDTTAVTKTGASVLFPCMFTRPNLNVFNVLYERGSELLLKEPDLEGSEFGGSVLDRTLHVLRHNTRGKVYLQILDKVVAEATPPEMKAISDSLFRWLDDQAQRPGFAGLKDLAPLISDICSDPEEYDVQQALKVVSVLFRDLDLNRHSAREANTALLRAFIESLPLDDLRKYKPDGRQLLCLALYNRQHSVCSAILDRFVDVTSRDDRVAGLSSAQEMAIMHNAPNDLFERIVVEPGPCKDKHPTTGDTLLHIAARRASPERVKYLIEAGFGVNDTNDETLTPILEACYSSLVDRVKVYDLLLSAGADPTVRSHDGWTVSHFGADLGHLGVLERLSSAPRENGWLDTVTAVADIQGETSRLRGSSLPHLAALGGRLDCLQYLLKHKELFNIDQKTELIPHWTILMCAIWKDQQHVIDYLLQEGASWKIGGGSTVLHFAARSGRVGAVRSLLKHGMEPDVKQRNGYTAAMLARQRGHDELAAELEAKAKLKGTVTDLFFSVSADSRTNETADVDSNAMTLTLVGDSDFAMKQRELGIAINLGDTEMCQKLLDNGASASADWAACDECDPVVHAASCRNPNAGRVLLMLLKAGGSPTRRSCIVHDETTAIQECARFGYYTSLTWILDHYPGLLFLDYGVHPLHLAALNKQNDCLELMLERREEAWARFSRSGCKLSLSPVNIEANAKETLPYRLPTKAGRKFKIIPSEELLEVAVDVEKQPNYVVLDNKTMAWLEKVDSSLPLHCAARVANIEGARLLLEYGANVNARTPRDGLTALLVAARCGRADEMIDLLLQYGATLYGRMYRGSVIDMAGLVEDNPEWLIANHDRLDIRSMGHSLYRRSAASEIAGACPQLLMLNEAFREAVVHSDKDGNTVPFEVWFYSRPGEETLLLNSGLDLSWIDPVHGNPVHRCTWRDDAYSLFRRLFRRFGAETTRAVLNAKPVQANTLLYNAAANNQIKLIDLFIKHGAEIDLKGGDLGSAIMVAASYNRLNAVKALVRAGAKVWYQMAGGDEPTSVFSHAKHYPLMQRWLLVDRLTEVKCITETEHEWPAMPEPVVAAAAGQDDEEAVLGPPAEDSHGEDSSSPFEHVDWPEVEVRRGSVSRIQGPDGRQLYRSPTDKTV
ncbi:uncharacterized protein HMPREF1541_08683 [Cyphellophora europaea CBS 101466]|uniref:Nephrocystin 3-like N-terminal domain-containing protein n=1 Tax=Cyphellophora europaea (strain CBS 101466) TaxID=1220924 RepID=W2RIY0_CYPE1|nr:uncharacterized protein HMPREF1541_08683 [Cyphellophora europaea CBS 101466]ETN36406.1 hypothetical protein HMPREF1541_08683 [Cyphellophora europaea CBS 101466]